ncbi:MAG: ABC transporter permease subunit [Deltaproteobacteria bacterium]|nr:ABC transporter permease subunit [Deltaproteobacteria bacterium]
MIARVRLIAWRELRELSRQPAMLAMIGGLFLLISLLVSGALLLLQAAEGDPVAAEALRGWLPGEGAHATLVQATVTAFSWLIFTQLLGIVGVLAGHTVLHDRQTNALPFLLLAPVRRVELMAGKVLGVVALPLVLYLALSGATSILAASLPITAPWRDSLPPSPAWVVAFLLGGPAWSLFTAAICAAVSGLSRDVRTAQQGVWFAMFFVTFLAGTLLSALLSQGVGVQLLVAALGLAGAAAALYAGSEAMSREVGR